MIGAYYKSMNNPTKILPFNISLSFLFSLLNQLRSLTDPSLSGSPYDSGLEYGVSDQSEKGFVYRRKIALRT